MSYCPLECPKIECKYNKKITPECALEDEKTMDKDFCEKYYTLDRSVGDLEEVSREDKAARYVLRELQSVAIDDEGIIYFKHFDPEKHQVKLLWFNDEPIGYVMFSDLRPDYRGPVLNQIYVKSEYRRKGFAQYMVEDFLRKYSGTTYYIESPNEESFNLLRKIGLVDEKRKSIDSRLIIIQGI